MKRTVFVFDEDADVRETLRTILEPGGYKGVCFADDTSLLEATRRRCPLAVLLGLNLQPRSGLEVLKDLRIFSVPVIVISGSGDVPTVVAAMKDGAVDFVQKPFERGDILERLENIVAG